MNIFNFDLTALDSKILPIEQQNADDNSILKDIQKPLYAACTICPDQTSFASQQDLYFHYKQDYHNNNIKRKLLDKLPLSLDDFESAEHLDDDGSIDGSDDDDDVGNDNSKFNPTPFARFDTISNKYILIYKNLFHNQSYTLDRLRGIAAADKTCAVLALGAGHFAGAIFKYGDSTPIVHKTFHRYTTRRKQGGSQSANDAKGGVANSAGAQIRRYNESALQAEIKDLLTGWKAHLNACDLVFCRISPTLRKIFFFDPAVLDAKSTKIRSIPFATRRPTFAEVERCFRELFTVRIYEIQDEQLLKKVAKLDIKKSPKRNDAASNQSSTIPKLLEVEPIKDPNDDIPPLEEDLSSIIDMIQASCTREALCLVLEAHHTRRIRDKDGISLLHIAAAASNIAVIPELIERGLDLNMRALNGGNTRPYDFCECKISRNAFREYRGTYPDAHDYDAAGIPFPLSTEESEIQAEKQAEKKRKQREREKELKKKKREKDQIIANAALETQEAARLAAPQPKQFVKLGKTELNAAGMSPEARARLDREKRAVAAEARMRTSANKCAACQRSLAGLTPFSKFNFKYEKIRMMFYNLDTAR